MPESALAETAAQQAEPAGDVNSAEHAAAVTEVLVEEVSIDGMCGVY
jgi:mycofactocin precursor